MQNEQGQRTVYFIFQKTKYIFHYEKDDVRNGYFRPLDFPVHDSMGTYLRSSGVTSELASAALAKYGKNVFDIPLPPFMDLFIEHAMAPFFVFQIFCVALWCLDEYWYYSVMTLFMLVMFEATIVKRVSTAASCSSFILLLLQQPCFSRFACPSACDVLFAFCTSALEEFGVVARYAYATVQGVCVSQREMDSDHE